MKAVNKAAICNVLKAYPNAKTKGFTSETRDYLVSILQDPHEETSLTPEARRKETIDLFEEQFPPRIIPDLFEIDTDKKVIRLPCIARKFNSSPSPALPRNPRFLLSAPETKSVESSWLRVDRQNRREGRGVLAEEYSSGQ
jgi:hypothetical protein